QPGDQSPAMGIRRPQRAVSAELGPASYAQSSSRRALADGHWSEHRVELQFWPAIHIFSDEGWIHAARFDCGLPSEQRAHAEQHVLERKIFKKVCLRNIYRLLDVLRHQE